jgi:hypothetical protein
MTPEMTPEDELRALPVREPPRELAARVRRAALSELDTARGPRWRYVTARVWNRFALPAAITVTVLGYLHWAVVTAGALGH